MRDLDTMGQPINLTRGKVIVLAAAISLATFSPLIYHHAKFKFVTKFYNQLNQTYPEDYVAKVARLVSGLTTLPQGEVPKVYTIKDVSKVQNDRFFANAQNWDEVLLFYQAQKAIIYRPETNEIIEVAQ